MSEQAVFGNQGNERADQVERPAEVPADPAHVEASPASAAPDPQSEPAPAPAEPVKPLSARDEIAKRFQKKRSEHEKPFQAGHVPPFVEAQQPAEPPQQPAQGEPAAAAPDPAPQPALVEPKGYTLKVRGRDVQVPNRDELLRIAEVEPHEANDYTDAQLVKIAQRMQAGLAYLEEGRGYRDQARVAVPAPAAPQAGAPQQRQSAQPEKQPSIDDLRKTYIEKFQVGSVEEAAEAHRAYEEAIEAERRQRQDAQSADVNARQGVMNDLRSFGERNQDIIGNQAANDLFLMTVTREMGNDLRSLGLTEQQLSSALTNPKEMTEAVLYARQNGMPVRTNEQLLEAAGKKVREAFRMPAPSAAPAPAPVASQPSRIEEKRTLPAQPTRSGNPPSVTPTPVDMTSKRKNVIAGMQRARTAPNVKEMVG